jgi:hypothetical protein
MKVNPLDRDDYERLWVLLAFLGAAAILWFAWITK